MLRIEMWQILTPLLILLIVAMLGVKTYENYVSYSGNLYDGSGNIVGNIGKDRVDPSGNVIDSSGNVVGNINSVGASTANVSKSGLITLSLTDLLSLFTKARANEQTKITTPAPTAKEIYSQIKPHIISDVQTAIRTSLPGAPYTPAAPLPNVGATCSDSMAQGIELQNAQSELIDSNEYIRKDSIPCYGCTLPQ